MLPIETLLHEHELHARVELEQLRERFQTNS